MKTEEIFTQIKKFMEDNSYFELDNEYDIGVIGFCTRENGNVGNEKFGEADMKEALRIKIELIKKFGNIIRKIEIDDADEWVYVNIILEKHETI